MDYQLLDVLTDSEETELAQHEATIERGLKTFVDVGQALLSIRDARLYRAQWGTFEDYCRERWNLRHSYANYLMDAAEVVANLQTSTIVEVLPLTESQARPLTQLKEPEQQINAWQRAVETAPNGKITAAHVQNIVDEYKAPIPPTTRPENIHVSDDSYEWYTPAEYIEAARRVMGNIDTDPASCETANSVVQADTYYTLDDDGLLQTWTGNVWLNPPYNMPWIERFIDKAIETYLSDANRSVMVLTNNSTDTGWFHRLLSLGSVCLTRGRIRFWSIGGEVLATRQGQAIFYLGPNEDVFAKEFSAFGAVVRTINDNT